ncbi:hypothetical protein OKE68_11615 [Riemerella anatipestifer]|uniref:Lipoprotein n=1 Tax=Riemerella anatipestifer TaxID=34085 RepID=A0AAP3EXF3_RIEAN|nr:hypothetical protein [Riemerella anatipestifer]MBT0572528.1 hypothetical protein [Riemerella anatipestifer]MCW0491413.1 hypothetical protein [Riemerella anatipestifer]MCW0524949.1 hypothetical protein [Riemerella anatipestifer]MDY3347601.1 hypothetical protein [Riemerella anatipestifer]MDY3349931.1 hypothetical protein [Riemerella anatipestifer]
MKSKFLLIIAVLLLFSCRTRKKTDTHIQSKTVEVKLKDSISVREIKQEQTTKVQDKLQIDKHSKHQEKKIEIFGNTEPEMPFVFHEVEGKDTLQSIIINGNAQFSVKSFKKSSQHTTEKKEEQEHLNEVQELARNAVSQRTINEVANEIRAVSNEVKSSGFTFGTWVWIIIGSILIIAGAVLYFYLKRIKLF